MHLSRSVAALAGVASIALILAGCGNKSGQAKKTITTSTDSELTTVNPSKTTAVGTFNVLNNVDEGLVRLGKDSKVTRELPNLGQFLKMVRPTHIICVRALNGAMVIQ